MKFNVEEYGRNEIKLGKQLLKLDPSNLLQHDRVCYWALKFGDLKLAKRHAKTPKMKAKVKEHAKREADLHG